MKSVIIMSLVLLLLPPVSHACTEYRIIDFGDHIEAVCVGEPLTEKQKEEVEKQKERENQTTELENNRPEKETSSRNTSTSAKSEIKINAASSDSEKVENNVVVISYDVKYIPSGRIILGRERPGEYSVKVEAKNNGNSAMIRFKVKQVDNAGYETESYSFSEKFASDEQRTVTSHISARQVPFIQNKEWILEATKY